MKKYIFGATMVLAGFAALPVFAQTAGANGTITPRAYCPVLSISMQRGARDVSTNSQVSQLQMFLADYYSVDPAQLVTGYFGPITQGYVIGFQRVQGLPTFGVVGQLTRASIASVCGQTPSVQASTQSNTTTNTTSTVPGGCMPGALFNSSTGQPCAGATSVPAATVNPTSVQTNTTNTTTNATTTVPGGCTSGGPYNSRPCIPVTNTTN